ncbi:MAG TPA: hypothetical protein VHM90_03450 [Phycisphaerae bacterium]|nr:hypothetical protein [Phycisphaerae bacterium]
MAATPPNVEMDSRFPSGEWAGFFIQPSVSQRRQRMDLTLTFHSGIFSGEGRDGVGNFRIRGRYDLQSGECTFHKHYVGQHSVFYRGWNEGKGIWGTWEIGIRVVGMSLSDKGGFHIWPKGSGIGLETELTAEADVPEEEEERVLVGNEKAGGLG